MCTAFLFESGFIIDDQIIWYIPLNMFFGFLSTWNEKKKISTKVELDSTYYHSKFKTWSIEFHRVMLYSF